MRAVYMNNKGIIFKTIHKPKCVTCGAINKLVFYNDYDPYCIDCWQDVKEEILNNSTK